MLVLRPFPWRFQMLVRATSAKYFRIHKFRSQASSQAPLRSRTYSVALVGLGYRGYRSHFLSLLGDPSFSITAVCDTNAATLESFYIKHKGIPAYPSLHHLLRNHEPDFAVVSVPHGAHLECITALSAKGVSVLKEKPVAESVEEYNWMTALPVKIGVTFQKRFEPHFLHFRSLIPLIGDVRAVEATLALNITNLEETWRASSGVGVTEDLGCHMIDLLVWLFGPPTSVMAHRVSFVRPSQQYGGDDISDIMMDWGPKNCIGHIRLNRVAHRPTQSITLTGTNGTLSLNGHEITHYDTEGVKTLSVKYHPTEKPVIQSMVHEFGGWITGRQPGFSNSLALSPVSPPRGGPRDRLFRLNTGASIPAIGLGTRRAERPGQAYNAVRVALESGYRHIDTAQSSANEHEIGKAIKDSGVPRNQVWVTTKLNNASHKRVEEALDSSLRELDMDYIDLYLMHWPISIDPSNPTSQLTDWGFVKTWEEMQKLPLQKARNIGVSNFAVKHLQRLLNDPSCKLVPAINQVELHPYWPSRRLLAYCKDNSIHCTGYSCLGSTGSPLLEDKTLLELCRKKSKSPQQILIRWGIQRGTSLVPKSVDPARIKSNYDLQGWALTEGEMDMLNNCTPRFKSCRDDWLPAKVFGVDD